jgi:hypothetical protein
VDILVESQPPEYVIGAFKIPLFAGKTVYVVVPLDDAGKAALFNVYGFNGS